MNAACSPRRVFVLFVLFALAGAMRERGATCQTQTPRTSSRVAARSSQRAAVNDKLLAEGIAAFDRGDTSVARDLLERALASDSQSVEAHTYLGVLADQAGELGNAERHFAIAALRAPKSPSARNNYGAILLRLKRTREATAEFEASLSLDPNQANALVNLAQIRFAGNTSEDMRVAAELFRRADALAPDAEISRALTGIALRRNDRTQAAEHYQNYATRAATANSGSVTDSAARAELGGALLEAKLLAEAEAELKAALALDATNTAAVARLARVYLMRKDIPAAGRTLEAAVARQVEAAPIYSLLAVVYEKSGHIENAIPAMRLAIQADPQSDKYRFQYGLLLANADAPAAAVIRLNEALQTFPKSARLWLGLGIANSRLGKNDEAVQAFNRAIELNANFAQAYAYLGMTRVEIGQYDEAIRLYEQALRKDPDIAVVHYLIADTLLKQTDADPKRIETHLKQTIRMDATYAPARLALGKLYVRTDRPTEAVAELESVVKISPDLAETYYQLGRAYGRLKRPEDARQALAKFKTLSDTQKQQEQDERREIVHRLADVLF